MAEKTTDKEEKKEEQKRKCGHGNIYERMAEVKSKLLGIKKTGKSDYIKHGYFELGDILPTLIPALKEERLFMQTKFSATEQVASLIIIDIDKTQDKIEYEMRLADCNMKSSHEIQSLGAAQTYARRYLILTAFDISDGDALDGGAKPEEKKPENKKKDPENKPEPSELENLKRAAWEMIKSLPEDKQAEWKEKCKGADVDKLKTIIQDLDAIIADVGIDKQAQITERTELRRVITQAIKSLPEDKQAEWQDVLKGTGEDTNKLKEIKQELQKLNDQNLEIF